MTPLKGAGSMFATPSKPGYDLAVSQQTAHLFLQVFGNIAWNGYHATNRLFSAEFYSFVLYCCMVSCVNNFLQNFKGLT